MGGMLTQPVTEKKSHQGEGLGLRYGLSSMQGWRSEMEDAHDIQVGLNYGLNEWSFFAVFDGHAGKRAAEYAASNLLEFILRDRNFELATEKTSDTSYVEPDSDIFSETLRVENISSKQPSKQTNQEDISHSDVENSKKSDEEKPEDQTNELSTTTQSSIEEPTSRTNASSDRKEEEQQQQQSVTNKRTLSSMNPTDADLDMVRKAINSGFLRIDQSMRSSAHDMSGCTAVCAFISPAYLFIANCGDSRAVLYDGKTPIFATEDHKPCHPGERKRIISAGGSATQRINGTLAVSRALGDFEFKKNPLKGPCDQLVSPEPEVTIIERRPEDQFLVLACDGIWDVIGNMELCKFIRYKLEVEPNLQNVCSSVLDVCLHKGSRDNMSIIIVVFENGPKFSGAERKKDEMNDEVLVELANSIVDKFSDFNDFLYNVQVSLGVDENQTILPPGAGIEAKYDLLHEIYEKKFEQQCESKSEE